MLMRLMHLSSFAVLIFAQIVVTFYSATGSCPGDKSLIGGLLTYWSFSNTFWRFYDRLTDPVGQCRKMSADLIIQSILPIVDLS